MPLTTGDSIEMEKPEWLSQMETVLEVLNEGVVIADDRGRILFANSRFLEMTGIPGQDLIGFDPSCFYSSQETDFLLHQMEIEEDLRLAARVQNSLAPRPLVWDTMSVDAFYDPVHSIGGDFALVNSPDQDHLSLLVCDVSGHGIGSALVANRIYSETTAHLRSGMPFLDMFGELNRFLIEDIAGSGMFVTLAAARIDARRRSMVFAGAGHPPAMLARYGQTPLLLESRSMILGALPDAVDATANLEVQLQPDDRIVLYTDGITEVFNSRGEMLGIEGVREIVRQTSSLPPHEMKQGILDGVAAWREGPATDDVSLMLVHVR